MRSLALASAVVFAACLAGGCDGVTPLEQLDAAAPDATAAPKPQCQWGGAPGTCMSAGACAAIADHTAEAPGTCTTGLSCCIETPSVAKNPPTPAGWKLMKQAQVTSEMTTWALVILHDPVTYPMFATTTKVFGPLTVLARVEWHPPDFQNGVIHRGVTLYVPL